MIIAEYICSIGMEGTGLARILQHSTDQFKQSKQNNYVIIAEYLIGILGNSQVSNAICTEGKCM
jgi:hypothetical protein